ncbi:MULTISPECIES: GNAT family N-acetyltransferase [Roseomonadaceae]|uniref:GNAT family N-acetyltransferase n=1 Tax=Falsiroseomonas oleicola TaxID=2801474 RepID=A0ABS6H889_9PROT|nr:GNAT family N-acetyltransferase [Roseomonas oleicola]MBU8544925.1 GNAT family N-acetyltransferase [Roseomonas oleicola]
MSSLRARQALRYRPISKADLEIVHAMDLDADQVDDYLGPLSDILTTVRGGAAHSLIGIQAEGRMIGFYVIHPDPRDATCWWLGWFILARAHQGRGLGRAILARIMAGLASMPACRRVRLIVVPGNEGALALYRKMGFRMAGTLPATGDLVMECALRPGGPAPAYFTLDATCPIPGRRGRMRLRPRTGPHAARVIGVERGPPDCILGGRPALEPPPLCLH